MSIEPFREKGYRAPNHESRVVSIAAHDRAVSKTGLEEIDNCFMGPIDALQYQHPVRDSGGDEHRGAAGARRFRYEPTYSFRSLSDLYIEYSPA
jgi:hypothetical protein